MHPRAREIMETTSFEGFLPGRGVLWSGGGEIWDEDRRETTIINQRLAWHYLTIRNAQAGMGPRPRYWNLKENRGCYSTLDGALWGSEIPPISGHGGGNVPEWYRQAFAYGKDRWGEFEFWTTLALKFVSAQHGQIAIAGFRPHGGSNFKINEYHAMMERDEISTVYPIKELQVGDKRQFSSYDLCATTQKLFQVPAGGNHDRDPLISDYIAPDMEETPMSKNAWATKMKDIWYQEIKSRMLEFVDPESGGPNEMRTVITESKWDRVVRREGLAHSLEFACIEFIKELMFMMREIDRLKVRDDEESRVMLTQDIQRLAEARGILNDFPSITEQFRSKDGTARNNVWMLRSVGDMMLSMDKNLDTDARRKLWVDIPEFGEEATEKPLKGFAKTVHDYVQTGLKAEIDAVLNPPAQTVERRKTVTSRVGAAL